jgi:tetratricopeptide (TPR) repeat protein
MWPGHDDRKPIDQLPPDVQLVGREQELEDLRSSLRHSDYLRSATIAAISGPPGVGKSALAISFAHSLKDRYPHAFYHDFELAALPWPQVLRMLLSSMGLKREEIPENEQELAGLWQATTEQWSALIVLDNALSYEQVQKIVPHSPNWHVIVTSRQRLSGLHVGPLELEPLSQEDSVKLFKTVRGRASLGPEDETRLTDIVDLLEGLPLAILVLAARVAASPNVSLARVLAELQRGDLTGFGSSRHRIDATLGFSYEALPEPTARLLSRLAAVPGGSFEPHLAAMLGEIRTAEAAARSLETLRDLQLLLPTQDEAYFRFHSIVRRFAIDRLTETEGAEARHQTLSRILDYYIERAEEARRVLESRSAPLVRASTSRPTESTWERHDALAWLTAERLNLVEAVKQAAAEERASQAWRLSYALVDFFDIRGEWEAWETTQLASKEALQREASRGSADINGEAHVFLALGRLHRTTNPTAAIAEFRHAIALFTRLGSREMAGLALHALGDLHRYRRDWGPATHCLEESHRMLASATNGRALAIVKRSLGALARHERDYTRAEKLYGDALEAFSAVKDERWLAATQLSLADILLDQRRPRAARPLLLACLPVFVRIGDRHWQALTLRSLGETMWLEGDLSSAAEHLNQSRELLKATGDSLWEAQAMHTLGRVHLAAERPVEAMQAFIESVAAFATHGDLLWEARTYLAMADAEEMTSGRGSDSARDWLARAWPLLLEQGAREERKAVEERLGAGSKP